MSENQSGVGTNPPMTCPTCHTEYTSARCPNWCEAKVAATPSGLTPDEQHVADALVAAWNAFVQIDGAISLDDQNDFRRAIHDAQRILMSRAVAREHSEYWRL